MAPPNYGIYTISIGIIYIILSIVPFYISKLNLRDKESSFNSSIVLGLLCLIIGSYFIYNGIILYLNCLFYIKQNTLDSFVEALRYDLLNSIFPYPLGCFVLYFISFVFIFIGVYAIKIKYFTKSGDLNVYDLQIDSDSSNIDLEISRKMFHICLISILIGYIFLGKLVGLSSYKFTTNIYEFLPPSSFIPYDKIDFDNLVKNYLFDFILGRWMVIFITIVVGLFLFFTDILRIFNYKYYPLKTLSGIYRKHEKLSFGPQIYLMFSLTLVSIFLPPPLVSEVLLISGMADALAAIVGISIGKRKLNRRTNKTWEGLIAGFITSFVLGFFGYLLIMNLYPKLELNNLYFPNLKNFSISQGIITSFVGAIVFSLIDYFTPPISIDDNILNPILCGFSVYIVSIII